MMAQTPDPQIKPGPNQRTGLRVTLEDNGMTESFSESVTVKLRKLRDLVCGGLIAAAVATPVAAAPPTAGDEMDYEASGFMLPPGVQPAGMVDGMPAMSMPPGSMPGAQSIATTLPTARLATLRPVTHKPPMHLLASCRLAIRAVVSSAADTLRVATR